MLSNTEQKFLDAAGAASYVHLAAQTLARLRCEGGGPPFCRAGRKIVYSVRDLDAWLAGRRFHSTSEYGVQEVTQ
jgi:hypothetical protein